MQCWWQLQQVGVIIIFWLKEECHPLVQVGEVTAKYFQFHEAIYALPFKLFSPAKVVVKQYYWAIHVSLYTDDRLLFSRTFVTFSDDEEAWNKEFTDWNSFGLIHRWFCVFLGGCFFPFLVNYLYLIFFFTVTFSFGIGVEKGAFPDSAHSERELNVHAFLVGVVKGCSSNINDFLLWWIVDFARNSWSGGI